MGLAFAMISLSSVLPARRLSDLHAPHRFPTATPRPKPVALLGEVALEDRFEHVSRGRFDGPIAHRGYAQRALLARPGFRNPDPTCRLPAVAFCAQFFAQPGQFGHSVFVELLDGLVIDSGSSVV